MAKKPIFIKNGGFMNKKLLGILLALSLGASVHQAKPFYSAHTHLGNSLRVMKWNGLSDEVIRQIEHFTQEWNHLKTPIINHSKNINALHMYFDHARDAAVMLETIYAASPKDDSVKLNSLKRAILVAIDTISNDVIAWIQGSYPGLVTIYQTAAGNTLDTLREKLENQLAKNFHSSNTHELDDQ